MSDKGTEQASVQKKKKARESGDVVRSRELLSAAAMLCGLVSFDFVTRRFMLSWKSVYEKSYSEDKGLTMKLERTLLLDPMALSPETDQITA